MYKILDDTAILRQSDGAIIPTAQGNADYAEYLHWLSEGNEAQPADLVEAPSRVVTRRQARLALASAGVLTDLETWIATQPVVTKIWYEDSIEFHEGNAIILEAASALNWSDAQLSGLFTLALTL